MNGEKGQWRGQLFDDRCSRLVRGLGYKEECSGKWGLDLIAAPPQSASGLGGCRPPFSPNGRTAFEFTCESDIGEANIEELAKKVNQVRTDKKADVVGGVLASDIRLNDSLFSTGEKSGIFLWDIRDLSFLAGKVNSLLVLERFDLERAVGADTTFLWKVIRTKRGATQARMALLFHHPTQEVGLNELQNVMNNVNATVTGMLGGVGLLPAQVETVIHSRSYFSKDLTKAQKVFDAFYDEEKINYQLSRIECYYQAPWSSFVP